MRPVFFLRHFNDIDHIAPVMWHCLEQGDRVQAVLLNTDYPADDDPRLQFLTRYERFHLNSAASVLGIPWAGGLFGLGQPSGTTPTNQVAHYIRRFAQETGITRWRAAATLRERDITVCIFEWGSPGKVSHREFFDAANACGFPTLCLPHGLNIYLNEDITPGRADAFEQGRQTLKSRNGYDAYVTQSEYDREQEEKLGVDPTIHHVLGSTRYYPEWQSINEDFYDLHEPAGPDGSRITVVFMLPHWDYYVDKQTTLDLIGELAAHESVYLVVKEHTRGYGLPQSLDDRLVQRDDAEILANVASVALIKWSDAIINFGSSIGIEALQQDKYHVNPAYLHSNRTIFDETGVGHQPASNTETVSVVEDIHEDNADPPSEENKRTLYRKVIYGGKEEHNVLAAYRYLIMDLSSS